MPTAMKFATFGLSDKGKIYTENQDYFLIDDHHGIYAVADGIGGLPHGAVASQRAIQTFHAELLHTEKDYFAVAAGTPPMPALHQLFGKVNQAVYDIGFRMQPVSGIGTTLTVVKVLEGQCAIGHIGDSAVFLIRDKHCVQWTTDHTMAQELRAGISHGTELRNIPESYTHALTRCIGQEKKILIEAQLQPVQRHDWMLLCSDGITRALEPEELSRQADLAATPQAYVRSLISEANRRGGRDNATAIALFFESVT